MTNHFLEGLLPVDCSLSSQFLRRSSQAIIVEPWTGEPAALDLKMDMSIAEPRNQNQDTWHMVLDSLHPMFRNQPPFYQHCRAENTDLRRLAIGIDSTGASEPV